MICAMLPKSVVRGTEPAHLTNPCRDVDGNDESKLIVGNQKAHFVGKETKLGHAKGTLVGGSDKIKMTSWYEEDAITNMIFNAVMMKSPVPDYPDHVALYTSNQRNRHVVYKVNFPDFNDLGQQKDDYVQWVYGQQNKICWIWLKGGQAPSVIEAQAIEPVKT